MLYGTDVAVCSDINTKHINKVWAERRNLNVKLGGTYSYHGTLKSKILNKHEFEILSIYALTIRHRASSI